MIVILIEFFIPHKTDEFSFLLICDGSFVLSYLSTVKSLSLNFLIILESYFKFNADLIKGNFFVTAKIADATCIDAPYSKFPATLTLFPALTILPDMPRMSRIDFGCGFEYTKLV